MINHIGSGLKPLFTKEVWALAWPMMLSNISIPLLGIVDTIAVGHLASADGIATIALGTMIFDILFWCFGFLRMSTTALAAQEPNSNQIYFQSSTIALISACLLIILSPWLKHIILSLIHTEAQIETLLVSYFNIRIFSAIPTLINYVNYGFFFGRQNTKTPLMLLLITNISAMLLDYILVWHFNMGANGIAAANVMTQTLGAVLGCMMIYKKYLKAAPLKLCFPKARIKQLFGLNRDIFIRTLFLVLTTSFFTRQSAALGVNIVAANLILMNLYILTGYALDGFAIAAEALIGRAVGNKNDIEFKQQIKACAWWSCLFGIIFMLAYALFGPWLIALMTSLPEVQSIALQSLPWVIALALVCVPGFLLDGVFIGAAWSKPLRDTILIASVLVFLPIWYFSQGLGNQGLWLAFTCFNLARGAYLALKLVRSMVR